nr:replicase protein [Carpotroche-associated ilarvirus]
MESVVQHAESCIRMDDIISDVIRRRAADESTSVGRFVADAAVKVVNRHIDSSPIVPLNVSFSLTPEEQSVLRKSFPGRELQFRNSSASSHSFAAAHRVCETDYIYSRFQTSETPIIDIGGNFCTHAKMGRTNVHSCCPILDVRDGARFTDRFISVAGALEKNPNRELNLNYCQNKFQTCNVEAPYAMAIHSMSDIPIVSLVKHMHRRGVIKLIGSVMMDPMMLVATQGFIPYLNVIWEIEELDTGEKTISFHFVDAPGLSYTHNYDILMQYMTCNQVIIKGKAAYRVERTIDLNGVFIVEITLAGDNSDRLSMNTLQDVSCAWLHSIRKKTLVRLAVPMMVRSSYVVKYVMLDTDFVRRVSEVSFRQYKKDTPIAELVKSVATMISSASNHTIINGVTMHTGKPIDIEDYVPLAVTFVAYAKARYDEIPTMMNVVKTRGTSIAEENDKLTGRFPLVSKALFGTPLKKKVDENSTFIYRHSLSSELLDAVKAALGMELWDQDDAVIQSVPSFFLMSEVCVCHSEFNNLSKTLDVDQWFSDLQSGYAEQRKEMLAASIVEEERKRKLENALVKIADILEGDDEKKKSGLLPLLDEPLVSRLISNKTAEVVVKPMSMDSDKPHINPYADSIKEAIAYFNELEVVATRNLRICGDYTGWRVMNSYASLYGGNQTLSVLDVHRRQWYRAPGVEFQPYERVMTVDGFKRIVWNKDHSDLTPASWTDISKYAVCFADSTCIFDSRSRLMPGLNKALTMDAKFTVLIEDGVAGCGKTTSLLKQAKPEVDLLLSANRETAEDAKASGVIPAALLYRVRTLDSYLMLSKWYSAERLLVDECFLVHSGVIYAAATLAQVKEVIAFGDTKQIPFVSRIPTFRMRCASIVGRLKPKTITYRCPLDVTAVLSEKFYNTKISSHNVRESSLSLININSGYEIPAEKDTLYIMHTQADKCAMLKHPGINPMNVMTTHEAQGKTFDNVILVRLSKTTNLLYSGKMPDAGNSHNLVGMTRHRKSLRYYSVYADDRDDQVSEAIRWSKTLTDFSRYRISTM